MVRVFALYGQPEDPAAFDRYYRDTHIGLAQRLPGLRRYTISRGLQAVEGESPYRLIAELDFDDQAAGDLLIDRLFPQVRLSKFFGAVLRDSRDDVLDPQRGSVLGVDTSVVRSGMSVSLIRLNLRT